LKFESFLKQPGGGIQSNLRARETTDEFVMEEHEVTVNTVAKKTAFHYAAVWKGDFSLRDFITNNPNLHDFGEFEHVSLQVSRPKKRLSVQTTICNDIQQSYNNEERNDIYDDHDTKIKKVRLELKDAKSKVIYFTGYFARLDQELDYETLDNLSEEDPPQLSLENIPHPWQTSLEKTVKPSVGDEPAAETVEKQTEPVAGSACGVCC